MLIDQLLETLDLSIALTDVKKMRELLKGAEDIYDNLSDREFGGLDYGSREKLDGIGTSLNYLICELNFIIKDIEENND